MASPEVTPNPTPDPAQTVPATDAAPAPSHLDDTITKLTAIGAEVVATVAPNNQTAGAVAALATGLEPTILALIHALAGLFHHHAKAIAAQTPTSPARP